jgi:transcriptional regulator with XRE-family HTH domain
MTVIAVRPEMLRWARDFRGLDLDAAAARLKIPVDQVSALERGDKELTLGLFYKYSQRLRIPRATLLRQRVPQIPPMPRDYRTLDGRPAALGIDTHFAITYAYAIEQNILELVEAEAAPPTPRLPLIRLDQNPENAGEAERQRIGVDANIQLGWQQNESFKNWRSTICL